jgi:hypothetical protein
MEAAGLLTLLIRDRDGEPIPPNVHRLDEPKGAATYPDQSPALLLALLIWGELPPKKQERIRDLLRCMAYGPKHPDRSAVQLHNLLSGRRSPC